MGGQGPFGSVMIFPVGVSLDSQEYYYNAQYLNV
jgi:hypothetical protein